MAFANEETVMGEIESLLSHIWKTLGIQKNPTKMLPFKRMTYEEAMAGYGSDKPDLRFCARVSFRSRGTTCAFVANCFLLGSFYTA